MKLRKLLSTLLAAALMCGLACTAALADEPANTAAPTEGETEQQPEEIEDWRAEQKIVVNGETYQYLGRAIFSETEDKPVTARLDSNVLLTGTVVLGTYDMGMGEMTVASHDVTIDLNGHTLKGDTGVVLFEVQEGYTLTIVDSSEAKTGKLEADGEPVVVNEGAVYNPLIEAWRAEQKIIVNGETYQFLLGAIMSETEDKPVTVRLESNVQLTGTPVILGTSDYDGMMGGREVTVASHDVTIDLNGFTLKAEAGKPVFEVQAGYTLTVVDSSEAQTGKLEADGEPVVVAEGAVYNPLNAPETPTEPTDPTTPVEEIPAEGTAYASTQNITIDGKAVEFQAYALRDANGNDTNYVKLRDVAYALNGSAAQFEVGYDGIISLTTKAAYTAAGTEMTTPFSGDRAYKGGAQTVKVDGQDVSMTAITLTDDDNNDYNYFKLRDLGATLGFTVGYSDEAGISITTAAE